MVVFLAAYDVLLVGAVLMLEMHYVIDVLVGLLMAVLAIAISGRGPVDEKSAPGQPIFMNRDITGRA
jgi:H+/Cl- antiporter ClcA